MTTRIGGNNPRDFVTSLLRRDSTAPSSPEGSTPQPLGPATPESRQPVDAQRGVEARLVHQAAQASGLQQGLDPTAGTTGGHRARRRRRGKGKKARRGLRHTPGQLKAPNGTLIGGRQDVKTFMRVQDKLDKASVRAVPGGQQAAGSKSISFTAEETARIRSAPTPEAAKQEVIKILSQKTGQHLSGNFAGSKGKGPLGGPEREALNQLLGTKIRNGREKNGTSAMILDKMAGSIAESIRAGRVEAKSTGQAVAEGGSSAPVPEGGSSSVVRDGGSSVACDDQDHVGPPPPPVSEPVTLDVSDYISAADKASELHSPLIFDLQGQGLQIKKGERVAIDLDGDGKGEMITNIDNGLGLLVFDAIESLDDDSEGAGRDYFGDRTDLTGYGIRSPRADGMWDNGFAALRALCESYELVHGDKQHLDERDLAFLESEVGLRMRIDGLFGEDRKFSEVGITRINIGDPTKVQSIQEASTDRFGNKLMRQKGATFIVGGRERPYADIWFAVTQRTRAEVPVPSAGAGTTAR